MSPIKTPSSSFFIFHHLQENKTNNGPLQVEAWTKSKNFKIHRSVFDFKLFYIMAMLILCGVKPNRYAVGGWTLHLSGGPQSMILGPHIQYLKGALFCSIGAPVSVS